MKTLMVKEIIKVRSILLDRFTEWTDWEIENDFNEAIEKYKKITENGNIWREYQIAKFYYTLNDEYLAWNCGVSVICGQVKNN